MHTLCCAILYGALPGCAAASLHAGVHPTSFKMVPVECSKQVNSQSSHAFCTFGSFVHMVGCSKGA